MANTYNYTVFGNKRVCYGTYTATSTTATIATGLTLVETCVLTGSSSATAPYIASISAGTVTATTASSDSGYYIAIGY